ncbi:MAG: hypothetical protein OHK0046_22050 [Anaerolineae bacterium]
MRFMPNAPVNHRFSVVQKGGARTAPARQHPISTPVRYGPLRTSSVLALLIVLLAFAVRFHHLGTQSLWHDEGNSYVQTTRTLAEIADNAARDIHPPGYYWLLAVWRGLMGESELALRALSAFASVLSVAFTYAAGRRLFGRLAGLTAALFVTLNTFSIYYAQEARMYALLALWSVAAMWALVGALQRPAQAQQRMTAGHAVPLLLLAAFNTAGLWTHYAFPFVMLAQGVIFVLWWMGMFRRLQQPFVPLIHYTIANLLTLLLFAPWISTALNQITTWPNTGAPIPPAEALAIILGHFGFGITVESGTTVAVAFFLLFGLTQREEDSPVWRMLTPVVWVVGSVGLFLLFGLFREANLKFLLPAQIGFALWMGRGVFVLWHYTVDRESQLVRLLPKLAAATGVLALVLDLWAGLDPLYTAPAYQRDDYRAITALIETQAQPGDAVILNAPNQREVFDYYYDGALPVYPLPRGLGGDDAAAQTETRRIIEDHTHLYVLFWGTEERDPNRIVENTLDAEAFTAGSAWYGGVRLARYATPAAFDTYKSVNVRFGEHITLERYALSTETLQPGDVLQVQLEWSADAPIDQRYKVFVQLLAPDGFLVAQQDSEPAGDSRPTTTWEPDETIVDNHAVIVPNDLPFAHYTLIVGLYNPDQPSERLPTNDGDFLTLQTLQTQTMTVR